MNAAEIAAALGGGRPDGQDSRCPCPICGRSTLALRDGKGRVKLLIKCWNGCEGKKVRAALKERKLLNGKGNGLDPAPETDEERAVREAAEAAARKAKIDNAIDIWMQAEPVADGPGATYLASRLLLMKPIPAALRFLPAVFHPNEKRSYPGLVARVDHETDGPIGIHCICLNPLDPSSKLTIEDRKLSRSSVKGGAVRLFPAGTELAIAEGIETALAFQQATGIPAWAVLGHTGLISFEPPPLCETPILILIEDQDEPGRTSTRKAARRLAGNGHQVRIARPLVGKDINDALLTLGFDQPLCEITDFALSPQYSDDDLALRFTDADGADLRYCALWGDWLIWTGTHWEREETLKAFDLARKLCRKITDELENLDDNPELEGHITSARTVAAIERLAKCDRRHATTTGDWDADHWLVSAAEGGTIELKTGQVRGYRRADYITRRAGSALNDRRPTPLWTAFLNRITAGDVELQRYLQRIAGYCLTGSVREHSLFFLYGTGANGKGVFLNTLKAIWGNYSKVAPMETFIETRNDRHPTELAFLLGARLVIAQETERGRRWAQAKLQTLTGGDPITARFMRENYFTFEPQFKLVIAGNHKPSLSSVDEAIRRRLHLIPFTVTIPEAERDNDLTDKLKAEWPGIFAWAVQGCRDWQKIGLAPPPVVVEASHAYFAEEDVFGRWIDECCAVDKIYSALSSSLFDSWKAWAEDNREYLGSRKTFGQNLEKRGFEPIRGSSGERMYLGIAIKGSSH